MAADPLSRVAQSLNALLSLLFVVHLVHSARALRVHLRSPKVALQPSLLRQFHLPLSSCLRIAVLAVSLCGIAGAVAATASAFLQLPPSDDGLRFVSLLDPEYPFSTTGRACIAFAKLGPPSYVLLKAFSYIFFFIKARTVRPLDRMTLLEKLALLGTLGMFGAAAISTWLIGGDRSSIDGQCQFHVPMGFVGLMLGSDVIISALYLYLFIAPLRATIAATRDMMAMQSRQRRGSVFGRGTTLLAQKDSRGSLHTATTGQPAMQLSPPVVAVQVWHEDESELLPASATVTAAPSLGAATLAHPSPSGHSADAPAGAGASRLHSSSQLELVMRKNTWSCCICIVFTGVVLGEICAAQASRQQYLLKAMWPLGLLDMVFTAAALSHLMHKSRASGAGVGGGHGAEAAAAAAAAATTTTAASAAATVAVAVDSATHTNSDAKVHPTAAPQLLSPTNGGAGSSGPAARRGGGGGLQQQHSNVHEATVPSSRRTSHPGSLNPLSPALQAHSRLTGGGGGGGDSGAMFLVPLTPSATPGVSPSLSPAPSQGLALGSPTALPHAHAASAASGPASKYHVLPSADSCNASAHLVLPQSGMAYATTSLPPHKPAHTAPASGDTATTGSSSSAAAASRLQLQHQQQQREEGQGAEMLPGACSPDAQTLVRSRSTLAD